MKYRKKPVVIEAVCWNGKYTDGTEWPDWFRDAMSAGTMSMQEDRSLLIVTLGGNHRGDIGDMVIRGTVGELYPCKPEIFANIYDPVTR